MSLSLKKLEPVCVRDPRTIVNNERVYAVLKGGSQVSQKSFTTTSVSNSSLQFSCPPPSASVFIDRKVYMSTPIRLFFTGTPPNGQRLLNPNRDAPRAYGLSSAIDTINMTINNYSCSVNLADIVHPLLRYNNDTLLKNHQYSVTPSYPDQSQLYSSLVGSVRNPLAGYGDSTDESTQARGGFQNYNIVSNPISNGVNAVTAYVDVVFTEPLFCLSPAYWGYKEAHPFVNVNTFDFNITFLNQAANRFWSRDETSTPLTSTSFQMASLITVGGAFTLGETQPTVQFTYITPQETQVVPRDMISVYPYFDIQRYATDIGNVAAGEQVTRSTNNIQLSSIPRRVYIFARKRNQDLYSSSTNTDSFLSIEKVSIQYFNKTGLLNSASKQQLYQMSAKNGCNLSFTQWAGGPIYAPGSFTQSYGSVGGVLCLEMGTDIGLGDLQAAGKIDHNTLQMEVTLKNTSSLDINTSIYIVVVNEGVFSLGPVGQASANIGVLTSQDILDCKEKPHLDYEDIKEVNGGDFLSGLKDFWNKDLKPFLQNTKLASNLSALIPVAGPIISGALKKYGYGEGVLVDYQGYGEGEGEGESEGEGEGGVMVGGRMLPRKRLRQQVRRHIRL